MIYYAYSHKMCLFIFVYGHNIVVHYIVLLITVSRSSSTLFLILLLVSANCWLSSLISCEDGRFVHTLWKDKWVIIVPHAYT